MRVDQASGGTNSPDIPSAAFAMPPGMRIRYDRPSSVLSDNVTGYAIYISDQRQPIVNRFLPSPAMITVLLDAGEVSVSIRNRSYAAVPTVSIWGATSHAMRTVTRGGIIVGVGLTALGWSRLTGMPADQHANTLGALAGVIGTAASARLCGTLDGLDTDADIAPALDRMLPPLFAHHQSDAALVQALEVLVLTEGIIGVADVAERLDISTRELRQLANRHFGMPSKMLLSRARFVRSYARWMMLGELPSYAGIDSSYFDASHFLRDAQTYLGMTPRRFASQDIAYLRASLYARSAVIGSPAHTLHQESYARGPTGIVRNTHLAG